VEVRLPRTQTQGRCLRHPLGDSIFLTGDQVSALSLAATWWHPVAFCHDLTTRHGGVVAGKWRVLYVALTDDVFSASAASEQQSKRCLFGPGPVGEPHSNTVPMSRLGTTGRHSPVNRKGVKSPAQRGLGGLLETSVTLYLSHCSLSDNF
jgi:hypothetical protein